MFSISIDSIFEASKKEQVSFIVRYINDNTGYVYERLLKVKESPCTSGADLFELFSNVMKFENLDWQNDLVGQSFDGASNMRGSYKGLQARIKEQNPSALFVWCHAQRINLVVKEAVSSNSNAVDMFGNLETLYTFFWCFKKRADLFRKAQSESNKHSQLH